MGVAKEINLTNYQLFRYTGKNIPIEGRSESQSTDYGEQHIKIRLHDYSIL
jgi:hypothetical protein